MKIQLQNINRIFKTTDDTTHALKDVNLLINKGEQVMIVGKSGSGKSTLLNIVGLLDKGFTGDYFINDINIKDYTEKELAKMRNMIFGYVFQ